MKNVTNNENIFDVIESNMFSVLVSKDKRLNYNLLVKIKDYIEIVDYIKKFNGKEFAENRGSKSILGMLTRNYKPRALNELFNK